MTPDFLKKGTPIGIQDRFGREICFGDMVKTTVGKPNNGYMIVYLDGSFCFMGGQIGNPVSFIKFRDELIEGRITGRPVKEPFQNFLEIVDNNIPKPTGSYVTPTGQLGGF